jgi:hypothetical protein
MALYPNGRYMTMVRARHFGAAPGLDVYARGLGDRLNRFVGAEHAANASTPDGYGMRAFCPPLTAGSLSALRRVADFAPTGDLLKGGPMEGDGTLTLSQTGGLSVVVSMTGTAAVVSVSADGMVLRLTIGMDGTGSWSLTGTPNLAMIVPFGGSGSFNFTGAADLRGRLAMIGEWTPFTELSPENLADKVLDALNATTIPVDVQKINGAAVLGDGTSGNLWRGA